MFVLFIGNWVNIGKMQLILFFGIFFHFSSFLSHLIGLKNLFGFSMLFKYSMFINIELVRGDLQETKRKYRLIFPRLQSFNSNWFDLIFCTLFEAAKREEKKYWNFRKAWNGSEFNSKEHWLWFLILLKTFNTVDIANTLRLRNVNIISFFR